MVEIYKPDISFKLSKYYKCSNWLEIIRPKYKKIERN